MSWWRTLGGRPSAFVLVSLLAQALANCDDHDQQSCGQCVADYASWTGCQCSWNSATQNCKGDCGSVDSGYTRTCPPPPPPIVLGPGDVAPGTRGFGENCGYNDGWCQAGLYCDMDGAFTDNDCKWCPCPDGYGGTFSCGRGSDGNSHPAGLCGSQRGATQDHFGCDHSDFTTCWECTSHTSSARGAPCTWNPTIRDCKADIGDWDAGYTHACEIHYGRDDVPAGTNRLGDNCGQNQGWCEADLYCDEDGPSLNECRPCGCPDGGSCGRGSDGNSHPYWLCGSNGGDTQNHLLPQIDFIEAFENAGQCIAGPFFSVLRTIGDMVGVLQDADDAQIERVCAGLVDTVQDSGALGVATATCDANALCAAMGPSAPLCEAISMTGCLLTGGSINPCAWLLDKATNAAGDGLCDGVRDTMRKVDLGACTTDSGFEAYADKVTQECCNGPDENCDGGFPNTCNAGCASVLLPMQQTCSDYLASERSLSNLATTIEAAARQCHSSSLTPPPSPELSPSPGSNSCRYAYNNECDDGSQGGTRYCAVGTDAADCSGGSSATASSQFTVESGPCTTTNGGSCVGRPQYGNHELCEIRSNTVGSISSCPIFQTERGYDFLNIDGTNYDGTNCPQDVTLSGGTRIQWTSDGSIVGGGWEICTSHGH